MLQGRGSMGADAALISALTSAAPTTSCDLSPGLLTLPGASAASAASPAMTPDAVFPAANMAAAALNRDASLEAGTAGWRGATEAQLREMERAWDEYKVEKRALCLI